MRLPALIALLTLLLLLLLAGCASGGASPPSNSRILEVRLTFARPVNPQQFDYFLIFNLDNDQSVAPLITPEGFQDRDLIGKGVKQILLNLGDVNYIDSSGLGELVSAFTTAKNQNADVKLLNLTKKVKDVLQVTKLYTVFDIYDDEAHAIASFK